MKVKVFVGLGNNIFCTRKKEIAMWFYTPGRGFTHANEAGRVVDSRVSGTFLKREIRVHTFNRGTGGHFQ